MNELQTFNFEQNNIRTVMIDNEPWFIAKDVAEILEYTDTQAMTRRLDDEEVSTYTDNSSGQVRYVSIINESGLYNAIIGSKKQEAKKFKKFVTSEILPTIRKHGGYLSDEKIEEVLSNPDTIIKLATDLKQEREKRKALEAEKTENKPYISFAKSVEASVNSVLIGLFAKTLSEENGVKIGQNRLFEWLRKNGYLMDTIGERYNTPYQKYIDNGYFEVATLTFAGTTGTHQKFTTKITGKGQIALAQKIVDAFRTPLLAA